MKKNVERITEGFFSRQTKPNERLLANETLVKDDFAEKLISGQQLTENDWNYVNAHMDGYVRVKDKVELHQIVAQSIKQYGNDVSLNWMDISSLDSLEWLFYCRHDFNGDVSRWDVSKVTCMNNMFEGCKRFDGDLSTWDVSSCVEMGWMFNGCKRFNQDISGWDVSHVRGFEGMFNGCKRFNQDLSKWNIFYFANSHLMFNGCGIQDEFKPKLD